VSSALKAALRIQGVVSRMHEITRLEYLPNRTQDLPLTLDIRRSSHHSPEAPSGGA
jgi:hypothetical protein